MIIASDTLVSLDGAPLGKPEDAADAKRMLRALSDREHEVFSGVCVMDIATGRHETRAVRTGVTFRALTDEEIDAYIATGEPMDKAGAYAIQGGAGAFVTGLDGSFENVMGFPGGRGQGNAFRALMISAAADGLTRRAIQEAIWAYFLPAAWASTWVPPM